VTTPEITPEIRQAVLDAECAAKGHDLDFGNIAAVEGRGRRLTGSPDAMPHIVCDRCAVVWIVAYRRSGRDYQQAERRFRERLVVGDPDALTP
jgi:hypothetical protein